MADIFVGQWNRGGSLYGGGAIDSTKVPSGLTIEGIQVAYKDILWNTQNQPVRSHNMVICQVVRSNAPFNLVPKRLVKWRTGYFSQQVDGYSTLNPAAGLGKPVPVDEFLPAAGVPQYDCFYVVIRGPALVLTSLGADATNVIVENGPLTALTGVTSGSNTSGRVQPADFSGATGVIAASILGVIGTAMTAKTTGNTDNDILVFIGSIP